jgi:hypothetical protein
MNLCSVPVGALCIPPHRGSSPIHYPLSPIRYPLSASPIPCPALPCRTPRTRLMRQCARPFRQPPRIAYVSDDPMPAAGPSGFRPNLSLPSAAAPVSLPCQSPLSVPLVSPACQSRLSVPLQLPPWPESPLQTHRRLAGPPQTAHCPLPTAHGPRPTPAPRRALPSQGWQDAFSRMPLGALPKPRLTCPSPFPRPPLDQPSFLFASAPVPHQPWRRQWPPLFHVGEMSCDPHPLGPALLMTHEL